MSTSLGLTTKALALTLFVTCGASAFADGKVIASCQVQDPADGQKYGIVLSESADKTAVVIVTPEGSLNQIAIQMTQLKEFDSKWVHYASLSDQPNQITFLVAPSVSTNNVQITTPAMNNGASMTLSCQTF